ncbi:hypothetical protein DD238_005387 [Peronospora effusa]|nr:hypothetical protein DD238_005387 [Peronospora effusa]
MPPPSNELGGGGTNVLLVGGNERSDSIRVFTRPQENGNGDDKRLEVDRISGANSDSTNAASSITR